MNQVITPKLAITLAGVLALGTPSARAEFEITAVAREVASKPGRGGREGPGFGRRGTAVGERETEGAGHASGRGVRLGRRIGMIFPFGEAR